MMITKPHPYFEIAIEVSISLLLLIMTKPVFAIEAQKPELSLAERILQQENAQREQSSYGDVKLLHSPNPMDVQFSEDGSVLFSQAETVRMWRSDNGAYLGSITGPVRFSKFAQINNSRWIVTLDDIEEVYQRDARFIIPQVIPKLRIWDVITGACLGIRGLSIPVNTTKFGFPALATADQLQMSYVIVHIDDDNPNTQRKLIGYRGQNLIPTLQLTLEDEFDSLIWDPHTEHLYLYGDYKFSCYDPASNKIVWTTTRNYFDLQNIKIKQLTVINQPLQINDGVSDHEKHVCSLLLLYEPDVFRRSDKDILLRWGLVNPNSGKPIKSGLVTKDIKAINNQTTVSKADKLIYWLRDSNDGSIIAVNILDNQLLLKVPTTHDKVVTLSRYEAESEKWYLDRRDYRTDADKVLWSRVANRVCSIEGLSDEIELFDSISGKRSAFASGTINALSKFSGSKISASLDWNEVSVFELNSVGRVMCTFNTKILHNSCVALTTGASNLLVGEASGNASLWSLSNHKKIATLVGGTNKLLCLAANVDHKIIIACDVGGFFWKWKFPTQSAPIRKEAQLLRVERKVKLKVPSFPKFKSSYHLSRSLCDLSTDALHTLSFKPFIPFPETENGELRLVPGQSFIAKIIEPPSVYSFYPSLGVVFSTEDGQKPIRLTPAIYGETVLLQIKISADGRFAMFVFDNGQVTIVDQIEGVLESIIQTSNREIVDVNYHPDQKTLLVASFRGTVTAWNSETFLKTGTLQLRDARINILSSRATNKGFDLVLGTWDTGLVVKWGAFLKSQQKSLHPSSLAFPFE